MKHNIPLTKNIKRGKNTDVLLWEEKNDTIGT